MRGALAAVALMGLLAPAALADAPPKRLFVIGDSLADDNSAYLSHRLPGWRIEQDISFARSARETARDLRARSRERPRLAPIVHVSSGTGDDPTEFAAFGATVRRVMRIAGPSRCVVWANIWRLRLEEPTFATLNFVLGGGRRQARQPAGRRLACDGRAHGDWVVDLVHVDVAGNRARARAVAREVRACHRYLSRRAGRRR